MRAKAGHQIHALGKEGADANAAAEEASISGMNDMYCSESSRDGAMQDQVQLGRDRGADEEERQRADSRDQHFVRLQPRKRPVARLRKDAFQHQGVSGLADDHLLGFGSALPSSKARNGGVAIHARPSAGRSSGTDLLSDHQVNSRALDPVLAGPIARQKTQGAETQERTRSFAGDAGAILPAFSSQKKRSNQMDRIFNNDQMVGGDAKSPDGSQPRDEAS